MTPDDGSEFTFACRCHRPAEDRLEDLLSETTPNCWTKYPAELPRKWEVEMYSDGASIVLPTPRGVTINGRPSTHISITLDTRRRRRDRRPPQRCPGALGRGAGGADCGG